MNTLRLILLLSAIAVPALTFADDAATIYLAADKTEELMAKDGQKITVYGETHGSGKSSSGMNFVNFKGAEFYLVTFKSDVDEFEDGEPADVYDEKRLAVTGLVSIYKEKPQIKLTSPDQVRILEEGEEFPPPGAAKAEEDKREEKPMPKKAAEKSDDGKKEEPKIKPPVDPKKYFK